MATRVLVMGATGTVGSELCRRLHAADLEVRRATRRPTGPGDVLLDLERPDTFARAIEGVERAFVIARPGDDAPAALGTPLVEALAAEQVGHLVVLTAIGADQSSVTGLGRLERVVQDSGLPTTFLRPNFFMQIFEGPILRAALARGELAVPAGDARISFIDARDIADVAARILSAPEPFRGVGLELTGPAAISHAEAADILSRALARPVRYRAIDEDEARSLLTRGGLPEARVERLLAFYRLVRGGAASRVSPAVEQVLGTPARDFATYARNLA